MIKPLADRVLIKMVEAEELQKAELYYQLVHKKNHK